MKDTRADLQPCRLLAKRTLRTRILSDKVAVDRLANNSAPCMEPESSSGVHEPVLRSILILPPPNLYFDLQSCINVSGFPTKTFYAFPFFVICVTRPAHFTLYNFTIPITFYDGYKLRSSVL